MAENQILAISEADRELYKDKIKVFVAQPTQGFINYIVDDNRKDLVAYNAKLETQSNYKFFTGTVGRLVTTYAREIIAERALDAGMDYILWIDDDMLVPYDLFLRLIQHNVNMVMPLTFMRVAPYGPVMWNDTVEENGIKFNQVEHYEPGKLLEVGQIGFGAVLMKVDILKKIPKPWFFNSVSVGEDIWFCHKANQAGIRCHVDTSFCIGHIGTPPIITEKEYLEYKDKKHITLDYRFEYAVKGTGKSA